LNFDGARVMTESKNKTAPRSCSTTPISACKIHHPETEGVGEMHEDQARWLSARARTGSTGPRFHRRAHRTRSGSLTLRPADALRLSPEPTRLGQSSKRPRRQPARVTRSSSRAASKTDSGASYFFFRRLVFFAVFFAAAFLFFAIATLLA
jgi:hypothetical protein